VAAALADAQVAIGFRVLDTASGSLARRLASRQFNQAVRALLGLPFGDTQCGLKGFRRHAAPGTVRVAVRAIAGACVSDPDAILRQLLTDTIADCVALCEADRSRVEAARADAGT